MKKRKVTLIYHECEWCGKEVLVEKNGFPYSHLFRTSTTLGEFDVCNECKVHMHMHDELPWHKMSLELVERLELKK